MARAVRQLQVGRKMPGPPPYTAPSFGVHLDLPQDLVLEIDPILGRRVHHIATNKIAKAERLTEQEAQLLADSVLNHRDVIEALIDSLAPGDIPLVLDFPQGIVAHHRLQVV